MSRRWSFHAAPSAVSKPVPSNQRLFCTTLSFRKFCGFHQHVLDEIRSVQELNVKPGSALVRDVALRGGPPRERVYRGSSGKGMLPIRKCGLGPGGRSILTQPIYLQGESSIPEIRSAVQSFVTESSPQPI